MSNERSFSNVSSIFFRELKGSEKKANLTLASKKQLLQKIINIPKRFTHPDEQERKSNFTISKLEFDKTVLRVQRLFSAQDLHLEAYRKLFSRYHPKPHEFYVWRPFLPQKTFQKSQTDFKKVLSTIQLRRRRIEKF